MRNTHAARLAAIIVSAAFMVGCDRDKPADTAAPNAQSLAAQAERHIEQASAVLDDGTITAKIKTALIAEPGLKGLSIDVDTSQNVVSLNGTVSSDAARKQAEEIARKVEGVKEVKNNLTVKPAA